MFLYYLYLWYDSLQHFKLTILSNSQLDNLQSGIKYGTEVTLKLSSNVFGNYND